MEAVAMWDFEASQPDEISFRKGARLCVISTDESGWCKAVYGAQAGLVPDSYVKYEPNQWFRTAMTRQEAEKHILLRDSMGAHVYPEGGFIVRKCESDDTGFALTIKHWNSVQHFKILIDGNNKFYIWPDAVFFSINQLVEHYQNDNVSGDPRKHIHLKEMCEEWYEAMFDFTPADNQEVELKKGDFIKLVSKNDENWWEGEVRGKTGFFPKNYVKSYTPNKSHAPH